MWINEIKWTLPVSHDNLIVKNIFSKCGSPTHSSDFLLFSSPLSTRLLIWPDTCFTLQHVNVKGTSLASVRTPTQIIIWSDVLDGAHGAPDNALKCVLTWSCPFKNLRPATARTRRRSRRRESGTPQRLKIYTFDSFFVKQTVIHRAVTWLSIRHKAPQKRDLHSSV